MPATSEKVATTSADAARPGLVPTLGLFTTIMMVVGGVIGSGIFKKAGVMAGQVGSPEVLFGVWVLAGTFTLFGALSIAEIAAMIPETGGMYVYIEKIYGPFVAYLFGWSVFAVIQTGSIAALIFICAECFGQLVALPELSGAAASWSFHLPYIGDVAPLKDIGVKGVAAFLIIALHAVNYIGVKFGGIVQNVFTIAKVGAMLLLIAGAFLLPGNGNAANFTTASTVIHPQGFAMIAAIAAALQGAFWAYDGWNTVTYIAGEVKEPQRNIPLATVIGMLIVMGLYLTMTLAYSYVLPIDEMAKSKLVATNVAEKCMSGGGRFIAIAVMLSTLGAANATVLASPRVYFSMAQKNVFFPALAEVHPRFRTPGPALIVQCVWSILLLFSGTFDTLTDTLIFVSWIFYAAGAFGVFVLRRREPDAPRPYRVPGYPFIPALFVLFALIYLFLTIYNDVTGYRAAVAAGKHAIINSAFGAVLMLLGTPIYLWYSRKNPR